MASRVLPLVVVVILLAGCLGTTSDVSENPNTTKIDNNTSTTDKTRDRTPQSTVPSPTPTPSAETSTSPTPSPTPTPTSTATQTPEPTSSPTTSPSPSQTVTSSPDSLSKDTTPTQETVAPPNRESPWGEGTVTVAVKNEIGNNRQFAPLVRDALAYWEQNSKQYAGYSIDYRLKPNATNPDIAVSFVSTIEQCGGKSRVEGCAPYIQSSEVVNRPGPISVKVHGNYTNESTTQLLIHEFGHTLGIDHGDRPKEIMAAESDLTTLPRPNVTERALPWDHSTLTVAVDLSDVPASERTAVNRQIEMALDYYDNGASGTVPSRVSFRRVSDASTADIVIRFSEDSPCPGLDSGSCSIASGYDPDDDGATETYARTEIVLTNVDADTVAWHVANRLGEDAFGFDEPSDYPKPLRNGASSEVRHTKWWTE